MRTLKLFFIFLLNCCFVASSFSQVGIGTDVPSNGAVLDVYTHPTDANRGGVVFPKMSTPTTAMQVVGMMYYDTDDQAYKMWDGSSWITISAVYISIYFLVTLEGVVLYILVYPQHVYACIHYNRYV